MTSAWEAESMRVLSSIPPLLPTRIPLNIEPNTNQRPGVILERSVSGWGATWGINFSLS